MTTFTGTSGNDTINGTAGGDFFNMNDGGNDTVNGGGGNDIFTFGGSLTSADKIQGSAGYDSVILNGDYAGGVTFGAVTMINVEELDLFNGHSYKLTMNAATIVSGQTLLVSAVGLDAAHTLNFDASLQGSGVYTVNSGAGNDTIKLIDFANTVNSGAGADSITIVGSFTGHNTINTGEGNDAINYGSLFTSSVKINGGTGYDTLTLNGNYSSGVSFTSTTMVNVEKIQLTAGNSYNLQTNDGNLATGESLLVNGIAIGASNKVTFFGSAETTGSFHVEGGAGNDDLRGGGGDDTLNGNGGADTLLAGAGVDTVSGGAGDDIVFMGANFAATDTLNGGSGSNTLQLGGDYSAVISLGATTIQNFSHIVLFGDNNYEMAFTDANVTSTGILITDDAAMTSAHTLLMDASGESASYYDFDLYGAEIVDLRTGSGSDSFNFETPFSAAGKTLKAGLGYNDVTLWAGTAGNVTFDATTIRHINAMYFRGAFNSSITLNDTNLGAGETMTVSDPGMTAGHTLVFNGAAETNANFIFAITGQETVTLTGGGLDDTFNMNGVLTASSRLDGGAGTGDTLRFEGDYPSAGITFDASTVLNIERFDFIGAHNYIFTTDDATVGAGQMLVVHAESMTAGKTFIFNGGAETNGSFNVTCGAGINTITGGAGADVIVGGSDDDLLFGGAKADLITGGLGSDTINGGAGPDHFIYNAVTDSSGTGYDVLVGYNATGDLIDLNVTVTGIDAAVKAGTLSAGSFDSDLANALMAADLGAHHAVVFTASAGTLAGHAFLVVDANGVSGYQAGLDYVMEVTGAANLAGLSTAAFI